MHTQGDGVLATGIRPPQEAGRGAGAVGVGVPIDAEHSGGSDESTCGHVWAYTNQVQLDLSRRGKPAHNAVIESLNGGFPGGVPERALVRIAERSAAEDRRLAMGLRRIIRTLQAQHCYQDTNRRI